MFELSDESVAPPLMRRLRDCPPLPPLPEQSRVIQRALARCRALGWTIPTARIVPDGRNPGLRFPAGFAIFTVDGVTVRADAAEPLQAGDFEHDPRRGSMDVWLDVGTGVSPINLAWTTAHEMKHVHDAATGRAWDRPAWERSAIAFAADAMRGWQW